MHISWSTSSARSKGGRSKRESRFSPFALSPPRLTSLFFFPQIRLQRQSQKGSGKKKGTISATIPTLPTKQAKNR